MLVPLLPLTCSMATSDPGWNNTWPISNHMGWSTCSSSQAMRVESAGDWALGGLCQEGSPKAAQMGLQSLETLSPGASMVMGQRRPFGMGPEPPRLKPSRCGGACAVSGSVVTSPSASRSAPHVLSYLMAGTRLGVCRVFAGFSVGCSPHRPRASLPKCPLFDLCFTKRFSGWNFTFWFFGQHTHLRYNT